MSKSEVLHELYNQCKAINFDESYDILQTANSKEEADFFRLVTDFILNQKQEAIIAEKRF